MKINKHENNVTSMALKIVGMTWTEMRNLFGLKTMYGEFIEIYL